MSVPDTTVLAPWANFYVIIGSSAAAMTGLMFIVITLIAQLEVARSAPDGLATYSTPTVVHLCASLLGAVILSAPWLELTHVAALLGLVGVIGVAYVLFLMNRMRRRTTYRPVLEDWIWYASLPLTSYATIAGAASMLPTTPAKALFPIGGALVLLIFIGIHNSWDIVTVIALKRLAGEDKPGADQAAG
jgi:hypothetical protein